MTDSKEYIEREALLQELEEVGGCDAPPDSWADGFDKGILSAIKHVEAQPAADVVEVVRCKDCAFSREFKIWEKESQYEGFLKCECNMFRNNGKVVFDKHYCSFGERKDGDGE